MSREFELLLKDHRLTTAEIMYYYPDFPSLLQTFVWQDLDLVPSLPKLKKFLDFWEADLDGKLHSVHVTYCKIISSNQYHSVIAELKIH